MRNLEGRVLDLPSLLAEDRAEKFLLRSRLGLALGRDLADEHVSRVDLRADADKTVGVEVHEYVVRGVGYVTRDLLGAQLGVAGLHLILLDVDRGEGVLLDELLGDDDRVLEVVALPRHESHAQVFAQRQLALVGRRAVGHYRPGLNLLAFIDERPLVDAGALVGAEELLQTILVRLAVFAANRDHVGDYPLHGPGVLGE